LPFSDERFDELLGEVAEERRRTSMHVVLPDGRVRSAGAAMIELMALNRGTRRAATWARLWPPRRRKIVHDYDRLAGRRGELSDKVADVPPTIVEPRRLRD
jgi:hypothetical protein